MLKNLEHYDERLKEAAFRETYWPNQRQFEHQNNKKMFAPSIYIIRNSNKSMKISFSNKHLETWAKYIQQVFLDIEHQEMQAGDPLEK